MHLRILQCLLVLLALALFAHASELRMSTAEVEANAPVDMAGHDTLTIYGDQTHDLLDLFDLSLASGTIRFESLDLANSNTISSMLNINAGTELVLDGVRTLNSDVSFSAAGGQVKILNSVLGSVNSPLVISHPLSIVEVENSAICRAQTGIRITAGQLTINNTLFLTNDRALEILGGQVTGLESLSFQGCKEGVRVESSVDTLSFTRCDFSGARDALINNQIGTPIQLDQCYIDNPGKIFGLYTNIEPVVDPWRPMEKPLKATIGIDEDTDVVPVTQVASPYTENGIPYTASAFRFYVSSSPYDFSNAVVVTQASATFTWTIGQGSVYFQGNTLIGQWVTE